MFTLVSVFFLPEGSVFHLWEAGASGLRFAFFSVAKSHLNPLCYSLDYNARCLDKRCCWFWSCCYHGRCDFCSGWCAGACWCLLVLAGACWCLLVLAGSPSSTGTVLSCKLSQLQRSEPTTSRIGVASCLLGTIAKSWTWIEILSSLIYRGCLSQYQTVVQPKSGDLQKSESDIPRKACQWARSLLQSMSPQTAIWVSKGLDRLLLEEPPGVIKASQNHPYHLLRYFSCRCVFFELCISKMIHHNVEGLVWTESLSCLAI